MLSVFAGFLPWIVLAFLLRMAVARRPKLSAEPPPAPDASPLVSIIVPARNEAVNISACIATISNSTYRAREIIVVDDNSSDGTGDIARILAERSDGTFRLVTGAPLPPGWLGKSWACWQGAQEARGELLLFTDADTRHEDALLGHAVGALQRHDADLVSVLPKQAMESFWERVVLPQIFTLITLRFQDLRRVSRAERPLDVFANGQFLLIRRSAYDAVGGHEALRGDVVEDVALAQRLAAEGRRLFIAHAEDLMETRMYRSLGGIAEGWAKNLATGARRTVPPVLRPAVPWLLVLFLAVFWVMPPVVLIGTFLVWGGGALRNWSLLVTAFSIVCWMALNARMGVPLLHALFYPLGALVTAVLIGTSAVRGERFRWKGRTYTPEGTALSQPRPAP
jgi:chlorobactene glucosyltransferase